MFNLIIAVGLLRNLESLQERRNFMLFIVAFVGLKKGSWRVNLIFVMKYRRIDTDKKHFIKIEVKIIRK